jgi:hypothetical protein
MKSFLVRLFARLRAWFSPRAPEPAVEQRPLTADDLVARIDDAAPLPPDVVDDLARILGQTGADDAKPR